MDIGDRPEATRRWYRLTPDRLVIGLLLTTETFLLLSHRFCWFAINQHKDMRALIALVAIGLAIVSMVLWLAAVMVLRRRFQFGLWSLLSLVVAIAFGVSIFVAELKRERREWEAALAFDAAGGSYDGAPTLLGRLLRDKSLFAVWVVELKGTRDTDALLVHLQELPQVQWLHLSKSDVSDAGLAHLQGLKILSLLYLDDTAVGDAGLAHLEGLSRLEVLDLNGTRITDAGLAHLRGLTRMRLLYLKDTRVADAGLAHLQGMKRLDTLWLARTQVTDAGLVYLQGFDRLYDLGLSGTKVTEQGLTKLQEAIPQCVIYHPFYFK